MGRCAHNVRVTGAAAIILAAGKGTRMRSARTKVLHEIAGRPLLGHVLAALAAVPVERVVVVRGPDDEAVARLAGTDRSVIQAERLGTAHAALQARAALGDHTGPVLILAGDVPLITPEALRRLVDADRGGIVIGAFETARPTGYGRLILDRAGAPERIVEERDASDEERRVTLCNGGIYVADCARLFEWLARVGRDNAQGEYYLTDIVALARRDGAPAVAVTLDESDLQGVNTRADLARAEALIQDRLRSRAMIAGVTLVAPETVHLAADTELDEDVVIEPNVVFGPGVRVGRGAVIRAFSHLEGASVAPGAVIGPFARLRPGTRIGEGAHIGNFVEAKNAVFGPGAKANHLSYIGDASVGAKTNIGAGTITCNYDGFAKYRTEIGSGVFVGSDSILVAPVTIGDGAVIAAGSVIGQDVAPDALAIARAPVEAREGGAVRYRARRNKKD